MGLVYASPMWGPNPSLLKEQLGVGVPSRFYGTVLRVGFLVRVYLRLSCLNVDIFFFVQSVRSTQLLLDYCQRELRCV